MSQKKKMESISGGIFLVGLGILFLTDLGFWPWILVVIGLSGLPASLAQNRGWYGWQGFLWMLGLAILFASGFFWPGILILVGASMLVAAVTRDHESSPFSSGSGFGDAANADNGYGVMGVEADEFDDETKPLDAPFATDDEDDDE